nr:hypothetical protein [Tanacetum cinerariifolium]
MQKKQGCVWNSWRRKEILEERSKKTQAEVTEGSSKKEGEELESNKSKHKLDEQVEAEHINREDLETLWKLVKAKYGNTRPEEGYERVL